MSSDRKAPDDRELEDFLAGKHPVGRAYREASERETAPRALDDAILGLAREHAAPATRRARAAGDAASPARRRPRWLQPVAVAATLALSLGVLMNIWRDPSLRQQTAPMEQGGEEASAEHGPGADAPVPPPPAAEPVEAPGDVLRDGADARPEAAAPASPTPRPAPAREPTPSHRAEPFPGTATPKLQRSTEPPAPAAVSPSTVAPRAVGAPPPPPPAAAATTGGTAPSRPDLDPRAADSDTERDAAGSRAAFGAIEASDDAAPSAAPPMPPHEARRKRGPGDPHTLAKEKPREDATAAATAEAERAQGQSASDASDALIERARAALARDEVEEARRLVATWRRLNPSGVLPEDLRRFDGPAP